MIRCKANDKEVVELIKAKRINSQVILTVSEAADFLRTTKSAIYAMVQRRQIPFHRLSGRRIKFFKEELVEILKQNSYYPEGFKLDDFKK